MFILCFSVFFFNVLLLHLHSSVLLSGLLVIKVYCWLSHGHVPNWLDTPPLMACYKSALID